MHMLRAQRRSSLSAGFMIVALGGLAACGGGGGGGGGGNNNGGGGGGGGTGLTLSLSTNALTFSAVPPFSPASEIVTATLTGSGSGTLFIVIVPSNPAVANVTNVIVTPPNSGQGIVVPGSSAALGPGSHSATITVRACLNDPTCATGQVSGSPQIINVTYNITGIKSSTANLTYNIGNAPVAGDLTRSFNVTGFPAQTWTITDNMPWLDLTPTTGSAPAAVSVSANLAATPLDELNNGTFSGTVTLTPMTGAPVLIPVTLNVSRTQVSYVAPYVAQTGVAGDVIIRGDNFNAITPTGVRFGTVDDATSFTVVSNTEIRATHGPLAAGIYRVHVLNGAGIDRTRADLQVVDAPVFAETTLQYPDGPGVILKNLVYDAERRAVFATIHYNIGGRQSGRLLRWAFTSAWEPAIQTQYLPLNAAALTTDGTKLLVAHFDPLFQRFGVAEVDPVTLAQTRLTYLEPARNFEASSLAVSNNGDAIIIADSSDSTGTFPIFAYSPLTAVLRQPAQPSLFGVDDGFAAASEDGSLVLVPNSNAPPPLSANPTLAYNSNTGQFDLAPGMVRAFRAPKINRHATRLLFDGVDVRDANLDLLGSLPNTTMSAVLAPQELVAYAYDNSGTVRVYDLAATPVGGIYPELTPAITLSNSPGVAIYEMTISPDGGTLFLGGSDQVVVVPLP